MAKIGELLSGDAVTGVTGSTAGTVLSGDSYGETTWGAMLTDLDTVDDFSGTFGGDPGDTFGGGGDGTFGG